MSRVLGIVYAALAALIIGLAPVPAAQASPLLSGIGNVVQGTAPAATTQVGWRGGRGYRGHRGYGNRGFRGHRGGYRRAYYRPHRGYYNRRAYYRPAYYRPRPVYYGYGRSYGARCFVRPARWVNTYYGYQLRPARRICHY